MVLPISGSGQEKPAGFLVSGISSRRALDDNYRGFLQLAAGHIATAVANAEAYEAERRRAQALAELDQAKTIFFSNVSHEFRTPLTLLLAPVEDALADTAVPLGAAHRERLEMAHRNGLRLLRLVNTLLDFSRIEAGRIEGTYQPTDLAAVTADLASTFRSAIERAGLSLVVAADPLPEPVFVDRDMWEKVILNLISNAFKFTLAGSITVSLRTEGNNVVVTVADTGTGIPPADLPHVFERFHRVKGAQGRTQEGTGIGLALVQELVRLQGGEISVASQLGSGTTFTIRLPRGRAHLPPERIAAGEASAPSGNGAASFLEEASRWLPEGISSVEPPADRAIAGQDGDRPRILLADDNTDMREYVARLLGTRWRVTTVADGEAALQSALADPPDLVLTDVMMPRLDGFGLLRALRGAPRTHALPVILLSARAGEEASSAALDEGADDYLIKPFTGRELLARVGSHLALARSRREAERAERDQLERVFALSPSFLAVLRGPEHVFDLVNPAYGRVTANRDLVGLPVREALPEIAGQGFFELLDRVYQTGEPFVGNELPVMVQATPGAAPEERFCNFVYHPMHDTTGAITGILVSGVDVTELVIARRAAMDLASARDLERSRLLTVLEQSPLAILIAEASSGRMLFANAKAGEVLGDEFLSAGKVGDSGRLRVTQDGEPLSVEEWPLTRALTRGETVTNAVLRIEFPDGRRREMVANTAPVRSADGEITAGVAILWDVTEERRRERQLRDAQRLQTVGTLAGGVAHEVNNQMTAVLGFANFALQALGSQHPQAPDLQLVLQAGERAARITQQLLAFSRRQVSQPRVVALHSLANDLRPVLAHLLGSDKSLEIPPRHSIGRAMVDPAQVEQVLINLVANARDAMETGGKVTIEVDDVALSGGEPTASGEPAARGNYVMLRVTDTGHGMSSETVARVFEPFYTTKAVGQGTGLGLSMVYGIVKQHGGEIQIRSEPGKGTAVTIYWPEASGAGEQGSGGAPEPAAHPPRPQTTVLIVEDEPAVRLLAVRALEMEGYHAVAATDGAEALRLVEEGLRPALVLTDVVMPRMNGRQLSEQLRASHPGMSVIYTSGYAGDEIVMRGLVPEGSPFLAKPFTAGQLVAAVGEQLADRRESGAVRVKNRGAGI